MEVITEMMAVTPETKEVMLDITAVTHLPLPMWVTTTKVMSIRREEALRTTLHTTVPMVTRDIRDTRALRDSRKVKVVNMTRKIILDTVPRMVVAKRDIMRRRRTMDNMRQDIRERREVVLVKREDIKREKLLRDIITYIIRMNTKRNIVFMMMNTKKDLRRTMDPRMNIIIIRREDMRKEGITIQDSMRIPSVRKDLMTRDITMRRPRDIRVNMDMRTIMRTMNNTARRERKMVVAHKDTVAKVMDIINSITPSNNS
jgi:hypothetical protein